MFSSGTRLPDTEVGVPAGLDETWRSGLDVLVRQLPVGVFISTTDSVAIYRSERMRQIVGVDGSSGERDWSHRLHPEDQERVMAAWAACIDGAPLEETARLRLLDGSERWVTIRADAARDEQGAIRSIIGTVEDITDLQELSRTWGERELMFDAVLSNSSDLVVVVDDQARLSFVSAASRRILGHDPQAWMGRNVFELLHPDDVGVAAEALSNSVESGPGVKVPMTVRVRHADGSWRAVEIVANNLMDVTHVGGLVITARDISERLRAEASAAAARDRFERVFDHAPFGIALVANDGRLVRVNAALARMVGRTSHELTGTDLFRWVAPEDRDGARLHGLAILRDQDAPSAEIRFLHADGSTRWARVTSEVLRDDDGHPLQTISHFEDVTDQRTLRERLQQAATHDPLTGLLNRAGLSERFELGPTASAAVIAVDLDRFKWVNDHRGHAAGDELLRQVAARLAALARAGDLVVRLGGDEFMVLALDVADLRDATAIGDRICSELARPFDLATGDVSISGSLGVALIDGHVRLPEALAAADSAAYVAKRAGGNRLELTWCVGIPDGAGL